MINPDSPIIGNQAYSHWLGINWVPLAALTIFHAAFSIAVPILLIELIYPESKGRRLLGKLGLPVTLVVYGLDVLLLSIWFGDPYHPPPFPIVFLSVYAAALILAAYLVPRSFLQAKGERPNGGERTFLLLGLGVHDRILPNWRRANSTRGFDNAISPVASHCGVVRSVCRSYGLVPGETRRPI